MLVTNLGRSSRFVANDLSDIRGLTEHYRCGQLAWEGQTAAENPIYGDGGSAILVVAEWDPHHRVLRFRGPASTYSDGRQQRGKEVGVAGNSIDFDIEIRDVDADEARRYLVEVSFDPEPLIEVAEDPR